MSKKLQVRIELTKWHYRKIFPTYHHKSWSANLEEKALFRIVAQISFRLQFQHCLEYYHRRSQSGCQLRSSLHKRYIWPIFENSEVFRGSNSSLFHLSTCVIPWCYRSTVLCWKLSNHIILFQNQITENEKMENRNMDSGWTLKIACKDDPMVQGSGYFRFSGSNFKATEKRNTEITYDSFPVHFICS